MKKLITLLVALMMLCSTLPMLAGAEDFNWRAYEGTKLQVMFNQHNYQKAITDYGKLEEFEKLTGIDVEFSVTPEENYFDKLNIALSSQSGEPDIFMTGAYQVWEYASAGFMEPWRDISMTRRKPLRTIILPISIPALWAPSGGIW